MNRAVNNLLNMGGKNMNCSADTLLRELRAVVGTTHVLTTDAATRRFRDGYRTGTGPVTAVVRPGSLVEQWRALRACMAADHIVIVQAANTGLTGGSTPNGVYDRPVVIISTSRIDRIRLIRAGEQAVCLSGATLYSLEQLLRPLGREPHSVIGSSCIGASVVGGVCNNSGGALIRRGPAYTEYAVFAQIGADGTIQFQNRLGLALGDDPETVLSALDKGNFGDADIVDDGRAASSTDYIARLRDVEADSPSRFNADATKLFEASGSAGKMMVFAVRLDTYTADKDQATFYVGTNDPDELTILRRRMLSECAELPVSAEYIHRGAFDIAAKYGKDVFLAIQWLGTDRLPKMFAAKSWVDAVGRRFGQRSASDRIMQMLTRFLPQHLPPRMIEYRDKYRHHLIIKTSGKSTQDTRNMLDSIFPSTSGAMFECSASESAKAFLHRFAVAGAAVRYRAIHPDHVEDIVALDVALRRNDEQWMETLPAAISEDVVDILYYGHFFCHVFHQDYIVKKGVDPVKLEHRLWDLLDSRRAEYPAEHNVGHLYRAKQSLVSHYQRLDPGNRFNPGIGGTSRNRGWR